MRCTISNCLAPIRNKRSGLCNAHYIKWRRFGNPLHAYLPKHAAVCSIKSCDKLSRSRGWCAKHYDRWLTKGSPYALKVRHELHGLNNHPLYATWQNMRRRCYSPKATSYESYGGRGITVCDRWRYSFKAFVDDMGDKPSASHSINRVDNDGNYEPKNCEWATPSQQSTNTRVRSDNKSGHRGVSWDNTRRMWRAYRGGGSNRVELGYYASLYEAVAARVAT